MNKPEPDLRFNKIKAILPNTFEKLKNLNTLLLNNNHITKIENEAFNGLKELRYLYLYKNRIRLIEADAFKGLHKLEQLYIHFNKIEKIQTETFADLPALERLFLHNNKLSRIPPGVFRKLDSLRRLRLDSNALICDCELFWLAKMLKDKQSTTQAAATCEFPSPLQGKSIMALDSDDFRCKMPKLTEEPHDVDVSFGGTAYFNCKADGDPKPDIVWLHNNNEIIPEDEHRYSILSDGTLMIPEAQDYHEGVYECKAKNLAGEVKSRAAKMQYYTNKAKLHFVETPSNLRIQLGSIAVLPCKAVSTPPPTINWTHNNLLLSLTSRHHISQKGTLTIENVEKRDAGIYNCIASNQLTKISSSAQLTILVLPTFLERPRDQEITEGRTVNLTCRVDGFPRPIISWGKDGQPLNLTSGHFEVFDEGNMLRIYNTQKSDEGFYQCQAENEIGQRNSSAFLFVREKAPPVFSRTPDDMKAIIGSNIELPCHAKGDPPPRITWKKDGIILRMEDNHHHISQAGDLYMFKVRKQDEGFYECVAENDIGFASVSMHLSIRDAPYGSYPGDRYLVSSVEEARLEVEKAINHTINQLFNSTSPRRPPELLHIFRFPNEDTRNLIRSAEIYERALQIVWNKVEMGIKLNLSEFSYYDILSPHQLELLANLSGCLVHRPKISCSDMCFHKKYRTYDGTCNNFDNIMWGASLTPFQRLLPPIYENGFNTPVGWTPSKLYHGFRKPSARLVSSEIITTENITPDSEYSHMLMQWGQFLDHDLDFSLPAVSHASFVDGVDCSVSCEYSPPCFPIEVPPGDKRIRNHQCMEFVRSSTLCGSGLTSLFVPEIMPREQANQLTSFIDASNVYGSTEKLALHLRDRTNELGLLRTGLVTRSGKHLLPFNDGQPVDCKRDHQESSMDCFLAGDQRANEQLGLLAMHTLWMREHNRIATDLHSINSHWNGDKLYHEARKIVGAEMQHFTYTHWLPKILGEKGMKMLGSYQGYNPNVNPSIANVFATAALRFGHTLINPILLRLNASFQPIPEGNLPLRKAFFSPFRLVEEGGIDPLLRGLFYAATKIRQSDQILNSELTEHLFAPAHLVAQDLASLNIQRGRDHALPSYNEWRKFCNLSVAESFHDLRHEIHNFELREKLRELYGHPGNIDLWVGGVSEDPVDGAKFGPTFRCLIVDQFKRLREGDRFWYENPGIFTTEQLVQIKQSSLGRVMCDNGDNITQVTRDVFIIPRRQSPETVACSALPKINLNIWKECCNECGNAPVLNTIAHLQYRTKRSAEFSYPKDNPLASLDSKEYNFTNLTKSYHNIEQRMREKDFDITEQRIEGIEELVGKLEKTINKLTKKLRRLEIDCKTRRNYCVDSEGKKRHHGDKWQTDRCTYCECQETQVLCRVRACPPAECKNPRVPEGQCCPVC
ncbi:peroxidasin isoform X2 [Centruroides vittatus]|uniref:peroxidasin isoform X2 n=1 Tax=Centruroides vittatus TaxID=120091 RepID=UPI00350F4A24